MKCDGYLRTWRDGNKIGYIRINCINERTDKHVEQDFRLAYYCELDFTVYNMTRFNRILAWYAVAKKFNVVKDICQLIARLIRDSEEPIYEGFTSINYCTLTLKQIETAFHSSLLDPPRKRKVLNCKIYTLQEKGSMFLKRHQRNLIAHTTASLVIYRFSSVWYVLIYVSLVFIAAFLL